MYVKTRLLLLCMLPLSLLAQTEYADLRLTNMPHTALPVLDMPAQDNATLLADEMARRGPGIVPRFAKTFEVDVRPGTHGTWESYSDGTDVWRLRVRSSDALSLNFGFTEYYMPSGGSLYIYSPDGRYVQGPFTPADNEVHEQLWTPVLSADEVVIQVQLPAKYRDQLRLQLKSINHDFVGFGQVMSGSCNLDVICSEEDGWGIVDEYRDIIQSVAVYGFGGGNFCTGFLINNGRQDCTPYFITAQHCGITSNNASSVVAYWNFVNSACRQPNSSASGGPGNGTLTDFNSGAIWRAAYSPSDFTLLEFDDPLSETADGFLAGWTTTTSTPSDTVIAVHHPNTDEKRISFSFQGTQPSSYDNTGFNSHVRVFDWDIGTTEGGSSGSPLFNADKQVIGQLEGGGAACGNNASDWYGWMAVSWEGGGTATSRLKDWLDPDNLGLTALNGRSQLQCGLIAFSPQPSQTICAPANLVYIIEVTEGFENTVTLTTNGLPTGVTFSFADNTIEPGGTTFLTIENTGSLTSGDYSFDLLADDGNNTSTFELEFTVLTNTPDTPLLLEPVDEEDDQLLTVNFKWAVVAGADSYDLQISTDPLFSFAVFTEFDIETASLVSPLLSSNTEYFWRVRSNNLCGAGDWSDVYSFSTGLISCAQSPSTDVPVSISQNGISTVTSSLDIAVDVPLSSIAVRDLAISHSFVGDLQVLLTSPDNVTIVLFDRPGYDGSGFGCNGADVLLDFEDTAVNTAADLEDLCVNVPPALAGTFQPVDALSVFVDTSPQGTWTLTVSDNADGDGGAITGWALDICANTAVTNGVSVVSVSNPTCINDVTDIVLQLGEGFTDDLTVAVTSPNDPDILLGNEVYDAETRQLAFSIGNIADVAGTYALTLQVMDADGTTNSVMLNVELIATPAIPALLNPLDGAIIDATNVVLVWEEVSGATDYDYEIATDDTFSDIVATGETTGNALTLDLPEGLYYWRVTANNDCGEATSAGSSFTALLIGTHELAGARLDIMPNPTSGPLYIELNRALPGTLDAQVFNTHGQLVQTRTWQAPGGRLELDLHNMPSGTYWVRLTHGQHHVVERIVLLR